MDDCSLARVNQFDERKWKKKTSISISAPPFFVLKCYTFVNNRKLNLRANRSELKCIMKGSFDGSFVSFYFFFPPSELCGKVWPKQYVQLVHQLRWNLIPLNQLILDYFSVCILINFSVSGYLLNGQLIMINGH